MIFPSTWQYLLDLVRESNKAQLLQMFCYYMLHDGESSTNKEIHSALGLSETNIKFCRDTLSELGFIKVIKKKNNQSMVETNNPTQVALPVAIPILFSIFNSMYTDKDRKEETGALESYLFTLQDVKDDEDWKRAELILAKYFKPYQYTPSGLITKKQYFGPLIGLVTDKEVDFEAYCKWYRVNKYPHKSFSYGLFLHPGVIAEFRDTVEIGESERYTNTSQMNKSESFKASLKKRDEFIASLSEDDDES